MLAEYVTDPLLAETVNACCEVAVPVNEAEPGVTVALVAVDCAETVKVNGTFTVFKSELVPENAIFAV
jgi:hypothetical protein